MASVLSVPSTWEEARRNAAEAAQGASLLRRDRFRESTRGPR